jgi:hypothetical protein
LLLDECGCTASAVAALIELAFQLLTDDAGYALWIGVKASYQYGNAMWVI